MSKDKLGARAFLKLKALEETRDFYKVELKKEDLTEIKRDKYLKALKLIERFIEKEKKPGEEKSKNPYLRPNGGFDLIEKFPSYKKKKLKKTKKQNNKKLKEYYNEYKEYDNI